MGATDFYASGKAKTAAEAFKKLVAEARHQHGHGGYTGTIAEKNAYVILPLPAGMTPMEFAQKLISEDSPKVCDKYGPAGCVQVGPGEWFFFGIAAE